MADTWLEAALSQVQRVMAEAELPTIVFRKGRLRLADESALVVTETALFCERAFKARNLPIDRGDLVPDLRLFILDRDCRDGITSLRARSLLPLRPSRPCSAGHRHSIELLQAFF